MTYPDQSDCDGYVAYVLAEHAKEEAAKNAGSASIGNRKEVDTRPDSARCAHYGGDADCPPSCLVLFGNRYIELVDDEFDDNTIDPKWTR